MLSNEQLTHAKEMLVAYQTAEKKIASGAVASYNIGPRALTYLNLDEIRKQVQYWRNEIAKLEALAAGRRVTRTKRFIPRDL